VCLERNTPILKAREILHPYTENRADGKRLKHWKGYKAPDLTYTSQCPSQGLIMITIYLQVERDKKAKTRNQSQ
jgi:hypothetical protein